jgi:hypothetical protein
MGRQEDPGFIGARQVRVGTSSEDGVLTRVLIKERRRRRMAFPVGPGIGCHAGAAWRPAPTSTHEHDLMQTIMNAYFDARPARGVRPTKEPGHFVAYSAPRTPVLPRGWAPLTPEQQRAVLDACDASPDGLMFRLGSLRDPDVDYRVYQLRNESWAGLWVASRCCNDCDVDANRDLLGLGADASQAVRIVLDSFNSDLEARGESWRLGVQAPAVPHGDPRRV